MTKIFLISLFLLSAIACDKDSKEEIVTAQEMLEMARAGGDQMEMILPRTISEPVVDCAEYTPRCKTGYKFKVKLVLMNVLEYETTAMALKAAKNYDGYVYRNWFFDHVKGEPVLERFVQRQFNAVEARSIKD